MKQTTMIINESENYQHKYTLTENEDGIVVSLSSYDATKVEETYKGKAILIDRNEFIKKTKKFMDGLE